MRTSGLVSFLKVLLVIGIIVLVGFFALRAAVGTDGVGIALIDVVLVPGDWFVPDQVSLADDATMVITGNTPGALWDTPAGERQLRATGSTLMLDYPGETMASVADDGSVRVAYTFPQSELEQSAGWRIVRLAQVERARDPAAAFVVVDFTKRVWLYRTGPLSWHEIPIP